jgi:hypothetical protein
VTTHQEDPEAARIGQEWADALEHLSEQDERLLTLLRLMGDVVDPRYEMKGIRLLVARALVDPELRSRALDDADAVLAELQGRVELPEDVRVRCVENTADYLTIVLPPRSESLPERSQKIRDFIFSRTSPDLALLSAGVDDNDVLPVHFADAFTGDHDSTTLGDPSHDG